MNFVYVFYSCLYSSTVVHISESSFRLHGVLLEHFVDNLRTQLDNFPIPGTKIRNIAKTILPKNLKVETLRTASMPWFATLPS